MKSCNLASLQGKINIKFLCHFRSEYIFKDQTIDFMIHYKIFFCSLVLILFSACQKKTCKNQCTDPSCRVELKNHTLEYLQLEDDQGNPMQSIRPLGVSMGGSASSLIYNGITYTADIDCGCTVYHIY